MGEVALAYRQGRNRFTARARVSVGTDLTRETGFLELRLRPEGSAHRFDGTLNVEGRQFRDDSDFSLSSDVVEGIARFHYRNSLNDVATLGLKVRGEARAYQDPGVFEYDQTRLDVSGTASFARGFDLFVDLEAGAGGRAVPDSTEIGYAKGFASADLSWNPSLSWSGLLHAGLERREYEDPTVRSHYYDFVLEPSLKWRFHSDWSLRLSSANEWLHYDEPTAVYFNLWLGWTGLEARRSWGKLDLAIEPRWSWLEGADDAEERYRQPSVIAKLEWFPKPTLWLSWSEEVGRRDYRAPTTNSLDLYSDYTFLRSTILFSWSVTPHLRTDFFLSDEPESHQREEDDGRLTLVTASVRVSL